MKRADVYRVVDGERDYQDGMGGTYPLPLEGELLLLQRYVQQAIETYATTFGDNSEAPTRDVVRKIAAIAIRAMEHHGGVSRGAG